MNFNHTLWSEVDGQPLPVDPAECKHCQSIAPNPCITHYILGARFQ